MSRFVANHGMRICRSLVALGCCLILTTSIASTALGQGLETFELPVGDVGSLAENVTFEITQPDTYFVELNWAGDKRLGFVDSNINTLVFGLEANGSFPFVGFLLDDQGSIISNSGFEGQSDAGTIDAALNIPTCSGMLLIGPFGDDFQMGDVSYSVNWANGPTVAAPKGTLFVPSDLKPGDKYHVVFATLDETTAESTDIGFYNNFVQTQAEQDRCCTENWGVNWFAIASTETVDARDNVPVKSAPVYVLPLDPFGPEIRYANDAADLWDGDNSADIQIDQFGIDRGPDNIWTGSAFDGTQFVSPIGTAGGLGTSMPRTGYNGSPGSPAWISQSSAYPKFEQFQLYAISEELTVPGAIVLGDANDDGEFNNLDISAFVLALTDQDAYQAKYPDVDPDVVLDMNDDGVFNNKDIADFVAALTG